MSEKLNSNSNLCLLPVFGFDLKHLKLGRNKHQLILNLNILGFDLVWINIWVGLVTADIWVFRSGFQYGANCHNTA